jgi:hypothetical protein
VGATTDLGDNIRFHCWSVVETLIFFLQCVAAVLFYAEQHTDSSQIGKTGV